jgi:hypothetical protein
MNRQLTEIGGITDEINSKIYFYIRYCAGYWF